MSNPKHRVQVYVRVEDLDSGLETYEKRSAEGDILDDAFLAECAEFGPDLLIRARNGRDPEAIEFYKQNPDLA